ncbi:MAG: hypothetical protein ACWGNP_03645, partial [Candidatus Bathyarchaeia archaeon]
MIQEYLMTIARFSADFHPDRLVRDSEPKAGEELSDVESYRLRIEEAEGFSGVWELVKETVKAT